MRPMRVLLLHNRYKWHGGEDAVVEAEAMLLRARGHHLVEHIADNRDILKAGRIATLLGLWRGAWSQTSSRQVRAFAAEARPDVVHVHNFWYVLSPSVLSACHDAGFPVVVTLHNFRLVCPGGILQDRKGRPCQDCVEEGGLKGVLRRCYHDSFLASAAVARMQAVNRRRGTWQRDVDLFIVPSEFCREIFVRGGFPAEKIAVKPNFVEDPLNGAIGPAPESAGVPRVLFVGRLSREKGLRTLLAAWKLVEGQVDAELRLVGDGPLRDELQQLSGSSAVSFAGRVEGQDLVREIERAHLSVLPSECYETFGRVVVESYVLGRPVVVSNIGGPAELVRDGETGLLFEAGGTADLAAKLTALLTDAELRRGMGRAARQQFLAKYTPEKNYEQLMGCYRQAVENHGGCGR